METVTGQWNVLRTGGGVDGLEVPSLPLLVRAPAGPFRLAVGPNGEARLLVPLSLQDRSQALELGPALRIAVSTFTYNGRAARFLDLTCLSTELEGVFADVVDQILARVTAGVDVIRAVIQTIEDFRALLIPRSNNEPDRNRIGGLVAELVILNQLLEISNTAWRAWRGPTGDRHDFRVRNDSLEVKASLRAGTSVVTINGLEQLEPPADGTLHLHHMVLEPVEGGLLTVSALGHQALAKANDQAGLQELLLATGCNDVKDQGWNRFAFRLDGEQLYAVSSEFPRIAPSCFPDGKVPYGVVDATYQIDLAFAEGNRLPPLKLLELLRGFAL